MTPGSADAPIGLFDSGIGGLTVARELLWRLPSESLLYVADTAHLPYGGRPVAELRRLSVGLARWLADEGCKLLVVACNTSSAVALDAIREAVDVPVIGVLEGGARAVASQARPGVIGVCATAATVASGAYPAAIRALRPEAEIAQVACPAWVPLVEAGRLSTPDAAAAVCAALEELPLGELTALVLGCTHYPFLAPQIRMRTEETCYLVDPAAETARAIARDLHRRGLLAAGEPHHRLHATGDLTSLTHANRTMLGGRLPAPTPWPVVSVAD